MYEPQTERVHAQPIVCSPPWINKYYIMDLAPGRSFIEYAVQHGFTVFCISYRNPDASMRAVSWDDYLRLGLMASLDEVRELTGSPVVNIVGSLPRRDDVDDRSRASRGERREQAGGVDDVTNTLVDFSVPGNLGVFADRASVARLEKNLEKRGYLEASPWRRPSTGCAATIWSGHTSSTTGTWARRLPAFDLLAWNGDSTNMPAAMHTQYLRACYVDNLLVRPGAFRIGDTPIDLRKIKQPLYVLGAENDHIAPWKGSYLLGGHVGGGPLHAEHERARCRHRQPSRESESRVLDTAQRRSGDGRGHMARGCRAHAGELVGRLGCVGGGAIGATRGAAGDAPR